MLVSGMTARLLSGSKLNRRLDWETCYEKPLTEREAILLRAIEEAIEYARVRNPAAVILALSEALQYFQDSWAGEQKEMRDDGQ